MITMRFKIETNPDEERMNELSDGGWELFHCHFQPPVSMPSGYGSGGGGGNVDYGRFITLWQRMNNTGP